MDKTIKLRQATWEDAEFLLDLKNDPVMRMFSIKTNEKIDMDTHLKWLKDNLEYTKMIVFNGITVGDVRVKDNEVAIKLHEQARGHGVAQRVIQIVKKHGMIAKIVDGNIPSMRLFIGAGFKPIEHKDNYYILRYEGMSNRT